VKTKWIEIELLREFEAEKTNAHRLATAADGWVERLGEDVLISYKSDAARERLIAEFISWAKAMAWKRIFVRFLPREDAKRVAPDLFRGDAGADRRGVVMERALRYGVDFSAGYSPGLFLDQRENRSFVRGMAPKSMLNCFSYTGSFSVAAAYAGARTLSIDLSRKSLERSRENLALNALSTDGHRFIGDDVLEVLPRLARKGEKFDLIVLDPPTFSRSRSGRAFRVESNFEDLLIAALDVAERRARILLSTNCSHLNERDLEVMARFCLKATRRAGSFHREPVPVEFPPGSAASTVWLTLH
jgi:23S rRNA (cytosine1962-C5)-methyltransferase